MKLPFIASRAHTFIFLTADLAVLRDKADHYLNVSFRVGSEQRTNITGIYLKKKFLPTTNATEISKYSDRYLKSV